MRLPTLTSLVGLQSDAKGKLTFQFRSDDGRSHYIPILAGVLNAMIPTILNVKSSDDRGADVQPVTLSSVRSAILEDGTPMLEIRLDGVGLRVALPEGAINGIRKALDECEIAVAARSDTGTRH